MQRKKIMIVDNELEIAEFLKVYLEDEQYKVNICMDGEECLSLFRDFQPHLIVLDIMLPGLDGLEVCRTIRVETSIPIIILSAKKSEADKVLGLGLGADDYVVKPFSPREVVARVKAQLRRYYQFSGESGNKKDPGEILSFENIELNLKTYTVKVNTKLVELTTKEFEVLRFLVKNANQVLTRQQIYDHVWGKIEYGDLNTVNIFIKKIREKIEKDSVSPKWIYTVWGVGYKFLRDAKCD